MIPLKIPGKLVEKPSLGPTSSDFLCIKVEMGKDGIIAVNTATFVGFKIGGVIGGIIATLGVVSPSIIIISIICGLIQNFSDLPAVQSALRGIQVAVCVLMTKAVINLYKKGVKGIPTFMIFAGAWLLSTFTNISTMILVIIAGICGYVIYVTDQKKGGEQA